MIVLGTTNGWLVNVLTAAAGSNLDRAAVAMLPTAFSYACGTVYGHHVATSNPAALACGQQACGAVVAAVISLLCEPGATWNQPISVWLLLAIVGVICSAVATALSLRLLARAASVPAALVAYLQPVWATILGWAVLGEPIRAVALLGTVIIVAGIALTTRRLPS